MIGQFSVPLRADEIQIGSGNSTDYNLPSHSYYKYSLTQQIYTATEIEDAGGGAGTINSIAFYNGGTTKTRNFSIYLVNTDKESFSGASDWIIVTANDLVFSGEVEMTAGIWKTITFSNPFSYDGGNLAVVVDDNTGTDVSGMACRIYSASATQAIYYRNDNTNPDPTSPSITGTPVAIKNQIKLDIEPTAVTCAKPKNFNAGSITAHEATLTWTAGAEGQSNWDVYVTTDATVVPDENTSPTYHVTTCSKALDNLAAQTTYYAYVRANCGGGDKSKWAKKVFTTTREALEVNEKVPYAQDFETANDWGFTNGTLTNQWCWGGATNNGGQKAMYVSNDGGTTYEYAHGNTAIYASKLFNFAQGTYTFFFDWNAQGESTYDYLRVALAPGDVEFTAGTNLYPGIGTTTLPSNWIALDGGGKLNLSDGWQTQSAEATVSGTYTMVFIWRNDGSGGSQPPAAIDNISISFMTCPRPTNLTASNIGGRTATLSWTENGTATNWVLQYATDASFTENLTETNVSGTPTNGLTGLMPETTYYARVKSVLGNDESSWSDVQTFTTTATCPKPTLSYVSNSNTAYTGTVNWTGNADNYELIYSTKTSFEPGDEGVTQINLGSVNTYTLQDLTPETTYRIKVRANCGAEDGYSQWSNQVNFSTTATCVAPSSLSATKTATTITLSWTAGATGQDAWDIRYKKSTDSEYTYIHLDNQTATNHTITGLNPVTTYSVNVRAYCSAEDQSKWGYSSYNQNSDLSVTTECGALSLPYTYGFEDNLSTASPYSSSKPFPTCWGYFNYQTGYPGYYTYYPYVYTATTSQPYAHGGNGANSTSGHCLYFYQYSSATNECAILPEISSEYEMNRLQIRFWAAVQSSRGTLSIGVMDSPSNASSFSKIKDIEISNIYNSTSYEGFMEYTVSLEEYEGNGRFIAIKCGTSPTAYLMVDDITVEEIPSCRLPKDLEATVDSDSQATLTWTAGLNETAWNVQYKKASDSEWSNVISVIETTCTLTQLKRATVYEARVQAVCSAEDQSDWVEVSFTTDCGIWPIDAQNALHEDFENIDATDFPPICWEKFNHEMTGYSYWYLNANNGLGSGAAYSSWNEGYAFLVMPQMHIDGDATLSFDHLIGSGTYNESCAVVVSTNGMTFSDFNTTIWEGNGPTSGKATETVSLSDYDGQDLYIAFKFKGSGTSGCTWYIDNVHVGKIFTKDITAYTEGSNDHYYLIASPIGNVNPENVENMLASSYDLYLFDQSQDLEWRNYKQGDGFELEPGKGYLYANSENVTLSFKGTPYNGNGQVTLTKDDNASFAGWNLVGNPFAQKAYITKPFYILNTEGSEVIPGTGNSVAAMEGLFVVAETDGETLTFSTVESAQPSQQIVVNVNRSRGVAFDRAIIRFGEGHTLPKFQIRENSPKVYISMNGQDYAVVRSESMDEIPINFKTEENGTYSINVDADNVKMNYLHLIDNMTGADIDLLENPCYTFEAKTTDYASRFKLVFATHDSSTNDNNFAFIDANGNIIVNGAEAGTTMQIVDITGRVIVSIDGRTASVPTSGMTAGVYVLRLINGNEVKTQKIVVR